MDVSHFKFIHMQFTSSKMESRLRFSASDSVILLHVSANMWAAENHAINSLEYIITLPYVTAVQISAN